MIYGDRRIMFRYPVRDVSVILSRLFEDMRN